MKKNIFVIPLITGALAFAGCGAHNNGGDRGGAATGRVDSGSSSTPGDHNAVGTDTSDSTRSRGGSTSGSSGSRSGSGSSSGSTSGGSMSGSSGGSSSGSTSGSGM